jgi:hypothetical protein
MVAAIPSGTELDCTRLYGRGKEVFMITAQVTPGAQHESGAGGARERPWLMP